MAYRSEDIFDQWLVLRCQGGEAEALSELVKRWHPRLVRIAARLTGDQHTATDAAQEAWLAIARQIRRLKDPAAFPGWAGQIVTRKAIDLIRRRERERSALRDITDTHRAEPRAIETAAESPAIDALSRALHRLDDEVRAMLALRYVDDMSIAQIANVFAIKPGTVKSRLFHARQRLRAIIESNTDNESEDHDERTG